MNLDTVILKDDFVTPEKWDENTETTVRHVIKLILNTTTDSDVKEVPDYKDVVRKADLIYKLATEKGEIDLSKDEISIIKNRLYILTRINNASHWAYQINKELGE